MFTVETHSVEETIAFAEKMGKLLKGPVVVAFFGGLGMGKTAFTKGLAKGLGISGDVTSPTFALVNEYRGKTNLYHFDMYRVETWDDLYSSGFFDYYETGGILACEWSENIENALPSNTIRITIKRGGENHRIFEIEGEGDYENFVC
ncbi:MAG: tRNA (adenosine(37)-N6)-threonylcarbamoyltransferase complex ATPase subunit type 1 TsaE [Clostridia bacterium]|nr:tRNA (adenosine(37)-N6)-threonylcarbamoyltransferase complex ATPase subunit type 1 TsaE [Clostridia bacterium]MBQ8029912.1 tRNA (adenosine(37)-N6)-threonylcarbamoyltransferase complex ATPase subunit type 1 TsaE [Clostridia bacterium]